MKQNMRFGLIFGPSAILIKQFLTDYLLQSPTFKQVPFAAEVGHNWHENYQDAVEKCLAESPHSQRIQASEIVSKCQKIKNDNELSMTSEISFDLKKRNLIVHF